MTFKQFLMERAATSGGPDVLGQVAPTSKLLIPEFQPDRFPDFKKAKKNRQAIEQARRGEVLQTS